MSKKAYVRQYQPVDPGPFFAQASDPTDFMDAQTYAHEHIEAITADFLTGGSGSQVKGFERTLTTGLSFTVAGGHAVTFDGLSYEVYPDALTTLTLATAHATLPRIDRVVAVLETAADAEIQFRPFQRIRTAPEIAGGVPAFPPENFNIATEKWNKATVIVKTGTPAGSPVAPTVASNEVALFQIAVAANLTTLVTGNFTDQRDLITPLRGLVTRMVVVETNSLLTSGLLEPDVVRRTGYEIVGSFRFQGLASATAPTVVPQGTTGSTSRYYWIVAKDGRGGRAMPSPVGQTTTGNAVLSGVNFDRITWTLVTYAVNYDVLVNTTNSLVGSVKLATTTALTLDNIGQGTSAFTQPTRNETKDITVDGYVVAAAMTVTGDIQAATISGAALTTQLDGRYANVTGDTFTGRVDHAVGSLADDKALAINRASVIRATSIGIDSIVTGNNGNSAFVYGIKAKADAVGYVGITAIGGRFEATFDAGGSNPHAYAVQASAVGGHVSGVSDTFAVTATASGGATCYAIYGSASGGTTNWAGYFGGNVNITGSLAKGSGTFFIDSPVDPFNKSVYHGFMESDEHLCFYRVTRPLVKGRVTINMDEKIKWDVGSFKAMYQDVQAIPVYCSAKGEHITASEVDGGVFTLTSDNTESSATVTCFVLVARADPEIKRLANTDKDGRLIVQHDKRALPQDELDALLADRVVVTQADEAADDTESFEIVPQLIGTKGYPLQPNAIGSQYPKRRVINRTVGKPRQRQKPSSH